MKSLLKTRRSSRFCGIAGYGIHDPCRPSTWVGDVTLNWNVADHPFVYSAASLTLGAKSRQVHPQCWASARRKKNRDECGGNWFILKDNLFYSAAAWMWMCKLCSSVKISRLDNNWRFCDVYVYKKKPPAFCRGTSEHGQLFTVPTLHSHSWSHWSASRGSDSFVLLFFCFFFAFITPSLFSAHASCNDQIIKSW